MSNALTRPYEPTTPEHLTPRELTLWLGLGTEAVASATSEILRNARAILRMHPGPVYPDGEDALEHRADILVTGIRWNWHRPNRNPDASRRLCLDLRELGQAWAQHGDEHGIEFPVAVLHAKVDEIADIGISGCARGHNVEDGPYVPTDAEKLRGHFEARRAGLTNAWAPIFQAEHVRQARMFNQIGEHVFETDAV